VLIAKKILDSGPPGMFGPAIAYNKWEGMVNFSDTASVQVTRKHEPLSPNSVTPTPHKPTP